VQLNIKLQNVYRPLRRRTSFFGFWVLLCLATYTSGIPMGTSLECDRTIKQKIYAMAGIAIYWILDLRDRQLEVYT
jgi:hypothetical protein